MPSLPESFLQYTHLPLTVDETGRAVRPDIVTEDGRTFVWLQNSWPADQVDAEGESYLNSTANSFAVWESLNERGVVEFPEVKALSQSGNEMGGDIRAIYIDARLDSRKVVSLVHEHNHRDVEGQYESDPSWLAVHDARLANHWEQVLVPIPEINALVDRWILESGMDLEIARLKAEDAQRVASLPEYDLDGLMRSMSDKLGKPIK